MAQNSEILTTPGLVLKVAKELGIPESDARHHVKFLGAWIEELASRESVHQIQIPHVGHLYPNVRRSFTLANKLTKLEEVHGLTLSDNQENLRKRLVKKAEYIQSKYPSMKRKSFHGGKLRFSNWYFRNKMGTAQLEKFQNEKNHQ